MTAAPSPLSSKRAMAQLRRSVGTASIIFAVICCLVQLYLSRHYIAARFLSPYSAVNTHKEGQNQQRTQVQVERTQQGAQDVELRREVKYRNQSNGVIKEKQAKKVRRKSVAGVDSAAVVKQRTAVITLTDQKYMPCALRFVKQIRNVGQWTGDLFVLTVGFIAPKQKQQLQKYNVKFVKTTSDLDKYVPGHQHKRKFRKLELLYKPVFRKYERAIYLDVDGVIQGPLAPLTKGELPEGKTVLLRANGPSIGKHTLYRNEFRSNLGQLLGMDKKNEFKKRFPDHSSPGTTCFMIIDMKKLKEPVALRQESKRILRRFGRVFRYHDQSLTHLQFYDSLGTFPSCIAEEVKVIDDVEERIRYCRQMVKMREHKHGQDVYRHGDKTCVRKKS